MMSYLPSATILWINKSNEAMRKMKALCPIFPLRQRDNSASSPELMLAKQDVGVCFGKVSRVQVYVGITYKISAIYASSSPPLQATWINHHQANERAAG